MTPYIVLASIALCIFILHILEKKFLNGIDLSDADYALYIKHKDFGEFMVIDQEALQQNQHALKTKMFFNDYFLSEGDRTHGIKLFKNHKLFKAKSIAAHKTFQIGTLADFALPVEEKYLNKPQKEIQKQIDTFKDTKNIFYTSIPTFSDVKENTYFQIYFPSISYSIKKGSDKAKQATQNLEFYKKWLNYFESYMQKKLESFSDYSFKVSGESFSNACIFDRHRKVFDDYLLSENGGHIYLENLVFYNFSVVVQAPKSTLKKILALDYSDCLTEKQKNSSVAFREIKKGIQHSKTKIQAPQDMDTSTINIRDFRSNLEKDTTISEKNYLLSWFEIKEKRSDKKP